MQVKSNLGPLAPPLAYKIDDAGNFFWTGLSKLTREEMLADRPTGAGLPQRKFAGEWLREYLQDGSQTQGTIEIAAERDGVSIATLRRAKFDLGVRSAKDGVNGLWYWSLPATGEQQPPIRRQDDQINYLDHLDHLDETKDLAAKMIKPMRNRNWRALTSDKTKSRMAYSAIRLYRAKT